MKIVTISKCEECPNLVLPCWARRYDGICAKTHKEVEDKFSIPTWCPLEKAKDDEPQ